MANHWRLFILVTVTFWLLSTGQLAQHDEEDWIDPGDMLNYDPGSKKMINQKLQKQAEVTTCSCEEQISATHEKYQAAMTQLDMCLKEKKPRDENKPEPSCDGKTGKEGAFFRQYVGSLLRKFGSQEGSYQMQVTLSAEDVAILTRFGRSGMGRVEDAHEVLASIVDHVKPLDHPYKLTLRDKLETYLGIDLATLFKIVAIIMMGSMTFSVLVRIHVPWPQIVLKSMLVLFFMSVPWNWWHMYKTAVARRHADLLKDVPPECSPGNQSAGQTIYQWLTSTFTFSSDECAKYHERLLVDPVWEVPPTQALAVTLTKFFLEPLRHIGVALSQLVRGLLEDMPLQLWPVVLILFIVLTFFILILACGYKVNIFHVFGLEPARATHHAAPLRVEGLQPHAIGHHREGAQAEQMQLPQPQHVQAQPNQLQQPENIPNRNLPVHDVPDNDGVLNSAVSAPGGTGPLPVSAAPAAGSEARTDQAESSNPQVGQGQPAQPEQVAVRPQASRLPTERPPSIRETPAGAETLEDEGAVGVVESTPALEGTTRIYPEGGVNPYSRPPITESSAISDEAQDRLHEGVEEVQSESNVNQYPRPPISESSAVDDETLGNMNEGTESNVELQLPIEEVGVQ